jgi:hypothetical protein
MAGPIRFVKEHPVGTLVCAATGMIAGPWVLGTISSLTGINIGLPRVSGGGGE